MEKSKCVWFVCVWCGSACVSGSCREGYQSYTSTQLGVMPTTGRLEWYPPQIHGWTILLLSVCVDGQQDLDEGETRQGTDTQTYRHRHTDTWAAVGQDEVMCPGLVCCYFQPKAIKFHFIPRPLLHHILSQHSGIPEPHTLYGKPFMA